MIYVKNVPGIERAVRVLAGAAIIGTVLLGRISLPPLLGYLLIASGGIVVLTGFFGFCPMCALAGRRIAHASRHHGAGNP